jgi:hypothetical protein
MQEWALNPNVIVSGTVALVTTIVWFIRLESKIIYLEKDHEKLVQSTAKTDLIFETKIDKLITDLNLIQISLTRIETQLHSMHDKKED